MKDWINENPMTFLLYIVFVVIAIPGAVLVVTGDLEYEEYQQNLVIFAGAVGLLGAGKAVKNGLKGAPPATEDGLPPSDVPKAKTRAKTR